MFNRLLMTIATAACLTGAYAVYAVLTRPFVVVPELPATSTELVSPIVPHLPQENVRVATTYLSELRWVANSPYMLRSGQAFIYTEKWTHETGDPRIHFSPFAMVWVQKDQDGREQAVSMVSDSASIRFASAFDEVNPNPGRVIGAVLDGDVQVKGPDGLLIVGKQFVFDESGPSLISANPVEFQYGSHRGYGRSLNAKLIPAEGPPGRDHPHVFGVRTIRLGSGTNPVTKKFDPVWLMVRMPQQGQQKPVKVQSRDLEFDVTKQTAHFSQSVVAFSKTDSIGWDKLECDDLLLSFAPVRVDTVAATPNHVEPKQFQHVETDLEFKQLEATGKLVTIKSDRMKLRASMQKLSYDALERRLRMIDPRPSKVEVSLNGSYLKVPAIDVLLREDGNSMKPIEVLCRGEGRLEMSRPESTERAFVTTWVRQLRYSTDAVSRLDLIELDQRASFLQPRQRTGLGADLIRLWLEPIAFDLPATSVPGKPAPATPEPQPVRLVAVRNVALVSPQLLAETNELDVRFQSATEPPRELSRQDRSTLQLVSLEEQTQETVRRQPREPQAQQGFRQGDSSPLPNVNLKKPVQGASFATAVREPGSLGMPIDIPDTDETAGRAKASDLPLSTREPLDVHADWIGVLMQRVEGETEPTVVEVESKGHVRIAQKTRGQTPFTAEGDRLHLQNRGLGREIVHLFGQPAHLLDRRLHVEGREINLDREANRVWVKGHGLLQLPLPEGTVMGSFRPAKPAAREASARRGAAPAKDPDLDVAWGESMEFDGRTARFIGKVRAELGLSRMRCEQMNVDLQSRISFTDVESAQQPELSSIHCREDVAFENSEYDGNKLIGVQRGSVAEFTVDSLKKTSFAQGPGHILVWQRTNGSPSVLGPRDVIQANRPISAVSADWNYTRVDFKGRMTGKIEPQRSTFHDSVWIVHGPVSRPNDVIDRDHLPPTAGSMRCNVLQFAHHSKDAAHPQDYQELVGTGNAQIEGRGFYANADDISYDGSKGMYMLRAHGNQSATIAQDAGGGPRREASGRRIEFFVATRAVRVDWANGATGGP